MESFVSSRSTGPVVVVETVQAKAEKAAAEAKALRDAGIEMADDLAPVAGNPNRKVEGDDAEWTSGIDAALGNMSLENGAGEVDRHPEKKLKAVSRQASDLYVKVLSVLKHTDVPSVLRVEPRGWNRVRHTVVLKGIADYVRKNTVQTWPPKRFSIFSV